MDTWDTTLIIFILYYYVMIDHRIQLIYDKNHKMNNDKIV